MTAPRGHLIEPSNESLYPLSRFYLEYSWVQREMIKEKGASDETVLRISTSIKTGIETRTNSTSTIRISTKLRQIQSVTGGATETIFAVFLLI